MNCPDVKVFRPTIFLKGFEVWREERSKTLRASSGRAWCHTKCPRVEFFYESAGAFSEFGHSLRGASPESCLTCFVPNLVRLDFAFVSGYYLGDVVVPIF